MRNKSPYTINRAMASSLALPHFNVVALVGGVCFAKMDFYFASAGTPNGKPSTLK